MGAKEKILKLLKSKVGKFVSRDEIFEASGKIYDWARVVRTLRQEGWGIEAVKDGYVLHSLTKKNGIERKRIDSKTRYKILQMDESRCQRCGRGVEDGVKLHVDHKIPIEWWDKKNGDPNQDNNLWTLCRDCNIGKKHLFSDEKAEIMRNVMSQPSGKKRLIAFFKAHQGDLLSPQKLQVVSGIRDWEREVRYLRQKEGLKIKWVKGKKNEPSGYILGKS